MARSCFSSVLSLCSSQYLPSKVVYIYFVGRGTFPGYCVCDCGCHWQVSGFSVSVYKCQLCCILTRIHSPPPPPTTAPLSLSAKQVGKCLPPPLSWIKCLSSASLSLSVSRSKVSMSVARARPATVWSVLPSNL